MRCTIPIDHSVSLLQLIVEVKTMARLICTVAIIGIALMCILAEEDKYDDKYDGIDMLEILINNELRYQYYNCFMDIGPCVTEDMKYFKTIINEAVQTQCRKCTEKQKLMMEVGMNWYTKYQPEEWNRFIEKIAEDIKKTTEKNND